jgi:hypothetical protein
LKETQGLPVGAAGRDLIADFLRGAFGMLSVDVDVDVVVGRIGEQEVVVRAWWWW